MFQAMDTDNSGAITFDELKEGLKRYGSNLKESEIRDLMDAVSKSSELLNFIHVIGNRVNKGKKETLKTHFDL